MRSGASRAPSSTGAWGDRRSGAASVPGPTTTRPKSRDGSTCHGSYVDEPLSVLVASRFRSQRQFVHANHLYSVAALTDQVGKVVERAKYDAYGKRTVLAADGVGVRVKSAVGNQIGFTGYHFDQETGLYYARARMYSPVLGRFISRDPLEYIDGWSMYVGYFAPNSTDPTGMGWLKRILAAIKLCEKADKLKELNKIKGEIERGIKSWNKRVDEHVKKLDDYRSNPNAHDNQGMLANAPNEEIRQKIIQGRIKELEGQIEKNRKEAEKAAQELSKTEAEIAAAAAGPGAVCCLAAPNSAETDRRQQAGEDVGTGEVLGSAALDLIGIVDPGVIDLIQMATE